jgi:hypothetical protein
VEDGEGKDDETDPGQEKRDADDDAEDCFPPYTRH